jgi:hypothetical protein
MRGESIPTWRWCERALAAAACLAATVAWTGQIAPFDGTLSVEPSSLILAGQPYLFKLRFSATVNFDHGWIELTVPPGWPTPTQGAAGSQGDVSCVPDECGPLTFSAQNITIRPTQNSRPAVAIDYYATVPATPSDATFTAAVKPRPSDLTATSSMTVAVTPSYGTLSVAPSSSVTAGASYDFVLKFSAIVNFDDDGWIELTVPPGWPTPTQGAADSQGNVSCVPDECGPLTFSPHNVTIGPALALRPTVAIDYFATVPATASTVTFTAVVTPAYHFTATSSVAVAVIPASTPPTSPTPSASPTTPTSATTPTLATTPTSPVSAISPTRPLTSPSRGAGVAASSSRSAGLPPHQGLWRLVGQDTSIPVALVLAAGFAVVLFAGWRQHHRPVLTPGSSVRAVPRAGPPHQPSLRVTGKEPTRTVRIEPHPGTTTTNEKPEP